MRASGGVCESECFEPLPTIWLPFLYLGNSVFIFSPRWQQEDMAMQFSIKL